MTEIRRNHAFVALVESYLEQHPNRKRSEEEIKELDARNTIQEESLRVKSRRRRDSYDDDDDYESDYDDSGDDDGSLGYTHYNGPAGFMFHQQCRECRAPSKRSFYPQHPCFSRDHH